VLLPKCPRFADSQSTLFNKQTIITETPATVYALRRGESQQITPVHMQMKQIARWRDRAQRRSLAEAKNAQNQQISTRCARKGCRSAGVCFCATRTPACADGHAAAPPKGGVDKNK
jgi:hypothetical protein